MEDASSPLLPATLPVRVSVGRGEVHLIPTVPGLESEGPRVAALLASLQPTLVALDVSEAEVAGLKHFLAASGEASGEEEEEEQEGEDVEEAEYDPGFARALLEYGPIALPPPDYLAAIAWAEGAGVPVTPVDVPQETYDAAFARLVGTWEFFRYGRRVRKLGKRPPQAATAHEFVVAWDRELRRMKGIARVEAWREKHVAERLAALARDGARVAAVVSAPREEGALEALRALAAAPPT